MIEETIEKIKNARSTVSLEYDEMLDVKKYMFREILKTRLDDNKQIESDCEYINSLNTLNPSSIEENKLSKEGLHTLFKIFGGYISIISTKQCEEDFSFDKPVLENELYFDKYGCNVDKKMYLKVKAQLVDFKLDQTVEMVRQQYDLMDKFNENFYAFKISDNRAVLLVNSFFRLYFDNYAERKSFIDLDINKFSNIPSFTAFTPNEVVYTKNRRYKYEIREIDLDTAEYINSLC